MSPMNVRCPKCKGTGTVALPPKMAAMLDVIRDNPGITTEQIRRDFNEEGAKHTTITGRVTALVEFNLVERQRVGQLHQLFLKEVASSEDPEANGTREATALDGHPSGEAL